MVGSIFTGFVVMFLMMALWVAALVLWFVALVDVIQRDPGQFPNALAGHGGTDERLLWILIVVLGGVVGAIVYYFVVMRPYPRRRKEGLP